MNLKKIKNTLQDHLENCNIAYALLQEENGILKREGKPPSEEFLEKKRNLLPRLDESLTALKDLRETGLIKGELNRKLIENTQKKLMKIFLLDRENERLLLKMAVPSVPRSKVMKVSSGHLQTTYGR